LSSVLSFASIIAQFDGAGKSLPRKKIAPSAAFFCSAGGRLAPEATANTTKNTLSVFKRFV
jgi:hypothetical protein